MTCTCRRRLSADLKPAGEGLSSCRARGGGRHHREEGAVSSTLLLAVGLGGLGAGRVKGHTAEALIAVFCAEEGIRGAEGRTRLEGHAGPGRLNANQSAWVECVGVAALVGKVGNGLRVCRRGRRGCHGPEDREAHPGAALGGGIAGAGHVAFGSGSRRGGSCVTAPALTSVLDSKVLVSGAIVPAVGVGHVVRREEPFGENTRRGVVETPEVRSAADSGRCRSSVGIVDVGVESHAGAAFLGVVAGAGEAAVGAGGGQSGGRWCFVAVTLPTVFKTEVPFRRAEGGAHFDSHLVVALGTGAEDARRRVLETSQTSDGGIAGRERRARHSRGGGEK